MDRQNAGIPSRRILPISIQKAAMMTAPMDLSIDEYLRERLMPVEGAIPHIPGIEMYGNSVSVDRVGGDLFEYINFQQRYDIDARIEQAVRRTLILFSDRSNSIPYGERVLFGELIGGY